MTDLKSRLRTHCARDSGRQDKWRILPDCFVRRGSRSTVSKRKDGETPTAKSPKTGALGRGSFVNQQDEFDGLAAAPADGGRGALPARALAGGESRAGVGGVVRKARGACAGGRRRRRGSARDGAPAHAAEKPRAEGADDPGEKTPGEAQGAARTGGRGRVVERAILGCRSHRLRRSRNGA